MTSSETPQLYLVTPRHFDLDTFLPRIERVIDDVEIACVRLALDPQDADQWGRTADALRQACHNRDIPVVADDLVRAAQRFGLDGVHIGTNAAAVRTARKELGADAIVGGYAGQSRHDGLSLGEAGADYVAFGPVGAPQLTDEPCAKPELFAWWSEMIELPVVADGYLTTDLIAALAPITDFFSIGNEIWQADTPADALKALVAPLRGGLS